MTTILWDEILYPFPNLNGCTIEVWEWINDITPHFIMGVIIYPLKLTMLVKEGAVELHTKHIP